MGTGLTALHTDDSRHIYDLCLPVKLRSCPHAGQRRFESSETVARMLRPTQDTQSHGSTSYELASVDSKVRYRLLRSANFKPGKQAHPRLVTSRTENTLRTAHAAQRQFFSRFATARTYQPGHDHPRQSTGLASRSSVDVLRPGLGCRHHYWQCGAIPLESVFVRYIDSDILKPYDPWSSLVLFAMTYLSYL